MKVISGGQIGADIAALRVAKSLGIETGGWMPRGFKTLDGFHPEYAEIYGLQCTKTSDYPTRTYLNVQTSDGTIRLARNFHSYGERCTLNACIEYKKPYFDINLEMFFDPTRVEFYEQDVKNVSISLYEWIKINKISVLNIAGNASKDIEPIVEIILWGAFAFWRHYENNLP